MRPVPLEKQWTLWPRIARPFECKTCGAQYGPTFDAEVESRARQVMRPITMEALPGSLGALFGPVTGRVHHRVPRYRYCRNNECLRFYDYDEEAQRISRRQDTKVLLWSKADRLPMRRKWLKPLVAANGAP